VSGPISRLQDDIAEKALLVRECCGALSIRLGVSLDWLKSYRVEAERAPAGADGVRGRTP
jgi:hypothetical protein